jgi:hypothetical protein
MSFRSRDRAHSARHGERKIMVRDPSTGRFRPPAAPAARRTLAIPLLSSAELLIGGIIVAVIVAGAGALYLKGHSDGYADGYAKASAVCQAEMAAQAAANTAAVNAANKQILQIADQADKNETALEAQLADIEAGSGGAGATDLGLSAGRMQALGKIR